MNDIKEMERILYKGLSNTKLSDIIMQLIIKLIISNAFYKRNAWPSWKLMQLLQLVNDIEELIDDELERGLKITEGDL